MPPSIPPISDIELDALFKKLKEVHNLDFSCYAKPSLVRRLTRICELMGFSQFEGLLDALNQESFIHEFVLELTVGVTEMFRDTEVWIYLKEILLPKYFKEKKHISVWHCGCSTGEEVYSLKIVFDELKKSSQLFQLASDFNPEYLEIAKQGEYPFRKIENYNTNYLKYNQSGDFENYYTLKKYNGALIPTLKENIVFEEVNITKDMPLGPFDIIFCRNVLIYFEQDFQDTLLARFAERLEKGGYLVLGQFESLYWCDNFKLFEQPNELINILKKR